MVRRGEITDKAWERISPLLPENGRRGKQWRDHRRVMNGILWRLRTVYHYFWSWRRDGTWEKLLSRIRTYSDAVGEVEWEVSVDSSVARAHQHAAGARRKRSKEDTKRGS